MSNTTKDGGPAFPGVRIEAGDNYNPPRKIYRGGMTLRDYFAAKAMQGFLANSGGLIQANSMSGWNFTNCEPSDVATLAYVMADAMLEARNAHA